MYNEFLNLKKMERLWSGQASGSLCCSSKRLSLQGRALTLHLGGFLELRMQRALQVNTGASINILQWLLELKTTTQGAFYSVNLLCQIGNIAVHFQFSWKALSGFCCFDTPQLELKGWVKRRQRLNLGPQLLHQISLCRGRVLFSSHWLSFEKSIWP